MGNRAVVKSESLDLKANQELVKLADGLGMKQQALLGRLISWLTRQDRRVQLIVLDLAEEGATRDLIDVLFWRLHGFEFPDLNPREDVGAQCERAATVIEALAEPMRKKKPHKKGA